MTFKGLELMNTNLMINKGSMVEDFSRFHGCVHIFTSLVSSAFIKITVNLARSKPLMDAKRLHS